MKFTVAQKEHYFLIAFTAGDESADLADALAPVIRDPKRFFAFDFTGVTKLDFKSLTQLEPGIQTALKSGRKIAYLGVDETVKAVLDVTGLLVNAVFFGSEKELDANLRIALNPQPAKGASPQKKGAAPSGGSGSNRLVVIAGAVACAVIIVLCVVQITQLRGVETRLERKLSVLELRIAVLGAAQDSVASVMASQQQEERLLQELTAEAAATVPPARR